MINQLFAGAGLGLLVGLLLGLSSSPVVGLVVGALATGMVALLGFAPQVKAGDSSQMGGSTVRLGGFGFFCAAAVLLGLCIRTHDWASPSIADQVAKVQKAGYTADQAREWVAQRNLGTTFSPVPSGVQPPAPVAASHPAIAANPAVATDSHLAQAKESHLLPAAPSVLFSGGNASECPYFDTRQFKNAAEQLDALRLMKGNYAKIADRVSALGAEKQKTALAGLQLLYCPQ